MKRKTLLIILCVIFILGIFCLQVSRNPTVNRAVTNMDSMGYNTNLTVTVNKFVIFDKDKVEQDLIKHVLNNDFKNMLLSYDIMGYPEEFHVTVYTNDLTRFLNLPAFRFEYKEKTH